MVEACAAVQLPLVLAGSIGLRRSRLAKEIVRRRRLSRKTGTIRNRCSVERKSDRDSSLFSPNRIISTPCQPRSLNIWPLGYPSLPAICRSRRKSLRLLVADFRYRSMIAKALTDKLSMLVANSGTCDRVGARGTSCGQQGLQLGARRCRAQESLREIVLVTGRCMNIWLLHPFAGGPGLGRHWRPFWLADAWTRMGHRPLVVSAGFHHLHREPQAVGPQRIGNVDFWFLETPRYGDGSLGRLWNNLSFGPDFV